MGSGISDMVGSVKDLKSLFDPNADMVKGTGQSVGDLKGIGYSDADIQSMGGTSMGPRLARMGMGAAGGGLRGMASMGQRQPQSAVSQPIQVSPNPDVNSNFDPNYLEMWRRKMMNPNDPSAFLGR